MSSEAALLREIELLSGAINRHKNRTQAVTTSSAHATRGSRPREVVINGAAYESSKRKLTRKDAPTATAPKTTAIPQATKPTIYSKAHLKSQRLADYKRTQYGKRNKVLYSGRSLSKKAAKVDKQCRFFSISGACSRGRTCPYQHDPDKVAICPRFLQRECPLDASACPLSHDPTPERVPLCVHFANNGKCKNGESCLYPHVHVGKRDGVCRDFAVLGYCGKGLNCDKQHIRECPDFAEKGTCLNRACKLPHVIRANRRRQDATTISNGPSAAQPTTPAAAEPSPGFSVTQTNGEEEFIPLTFHESTDDEDSDDDGASGDDAMST